MALEAIKNFKIGPLFTPPSLVVPGGNQGTLGASERERRRELVGGRGRSRDRHALRAVAEHQMSVLRLEAAAARAEEHAALHGGPQGRPRHAMPQGLPLFKPPYSRMTAIDMNTGEHAWMMPLGDGNSVRHHPMLKALNLPPVGGDSTLSGPLLTKTLLISALTRGGTKDGPRLVALRQGDGGRDCVGGPAGSGDRDADDLHARRQAVHRADGRQQPGARADRVRAPLACRYRSPR